MRSIVHLGKFYPPVSGGIESVTSTLAKGASGAGDDVTVVCFDFGDDSRREINDGVSVVRCPTKLTVASQPLGLRYFLESISAAQKSELVHLHAPNFLAAFCVLFIGRRPKLVVHWHSDVIGKGFFGLLFRPLEWALLWRSDVIIATSSAYLESSRTLRPFRRKACVIPIGVADPTARRIEADSNDAEFEFEVLKNRKVILSVGRLVPYKGFEFLIEAARYIPENSVIVVVGDGPLRVRYSELVALYGVGDKIIFAGRVSDEFLRVLYERSSIYCLSSINRAEAFGVVLVEAMANGLPVVATNIPGSGVSWVNRHGQSGLNVPVCNPKAMADAFCRILASMSLQKTLAHGARARYLENFTEREFVKNVISLYENILVK